MVKGNILKSSYSQSYKPGVLPISKSRTITLWSSLESFEHESNNPKKLSGTGTKYYNAALISCFFQLDKYAKINSSALANKTNHSVPEIVYNYGPIYLLSIEFN